MVSRSEKLPSALRGRPAADVKQVAGRLCLDFANLVGGWQDSALAREDRLTEYADLLAWSWKAGLLDDTAAARLWRESQERPREAASVLARARRLRDSIHAIAWASEGHAQRRRTWTSWPRKLASLAAASTSRHRRAGSSSADGRPQGARLGLWPSPCLPRATSRART